MINFIAYGILPKSSSQALTQYGVSLYLAGFCLARKKKIERPDPLWGNTERGDFRYIPSIPPRNKDGEYGHLGDMPSAPLSILVDSYSRLW